jgi:hypothetical protein
MSTTKTAVKSSKTTKTAKKVTESKVKKDVKITFDHSKQANQEVKKYNKTFKGVRSALLSGRTDKEVKLDAFEVKVLQESKKDGKLYAFLLENSKYARDFKTKTGKHIKFSNYNTWSVLGCIRKLANDAKKCNEFGLKF